MKPLITLQIIASDLEAGFELSAVQRAVLGRATRTATGKLAALADYCVMLSRAVTMRLSGNVDHALRLEQDAERLRRHL